MKAISHDEAAAITTRLGTVREHSREVTDFLRRVAAASGRSERTLWRWLARGEPPTPRTPKALDREAQVRIAGASGNMKQAWRAECAQGRAAISYSQFTRRVRALPTDVAAGILRGMPAAIQKGLYNTREDPPKMQLVGFDHTECPTWCPRPDTDERFHPWLTVCIDYGTRVALSVVLTEGRGVGGDPNTKSVVASVGSALLGWDVAGTHIGGRFDVIVADNAKAHLAMAVVNGYAALGILPHFTRIASPWENGRVEAFMKTIQNEFFATLPGYTHHLELRYAHELWARGQYLTMEELVVRLNEWISFYNCERGHEALSGRTPLQAWRDDPTVVEQVDPALVRQAFQQEGSVRRISKNGVRWRGVDYQAKGLSGYVGRSAKIRYLPNDRSFIDIYVGGQHICTAHPAPHLSLEQKALVARQRRSRVGMIDRIQKESAKRSRQRVLSEASTLGTHTPDPDEAAAEQLLENSITLRPVILRIAPTMPQGARRIQSDEQRSHSSPDRPAPAAAHAWDRDRSHCGHRSAENDAAVRCADGEDPRDRGG